MNKFKLIVFSLLSLAVATSANAATDLGSGYSCDGTKIIKKGKEVKVGKAIDAVQAQIDKLGSGKAAKAKKVTLKALKTALKNCSKGLISSDTIASVYGPRARESFFNSGPISGFGDTPAYASIQVSQGENYLITISIGENAPAGQRYFADFEPGPLVDVPATQALPFTKTVVSGNGGNKTILIEKTKVTFTWEGILAGTTKNGSTITKVEAVLTLADNNGYTGTLKYFNGASAVVSGTFTVQ